MRRLDEALEVALGVFMVVLMVTGLALFATIMIVAIHGIWMNR